MAKIRGIEEQKKALEKVESNLKELQNMKEFLMSENPSNEYEINFKKTEKILSEEGEKTKNKKVAVKFKLSNKEQLKNLLAEYRNYLIQETRRLAEQFIIELDEDEKRLLQ